MSTWSSKIIRNLPYAISCARKASATCAKCCMSFARSSSSGSRMLANMAPYGAVDACKTVGQYMTQKTVGPALSTTRTRNFAKRPPGCRLLEQCIRLQGGTERGFLLLVYVRHLGLKHVQEVRVRIPHPTDSAMSGNSSVTVPGMALFLFLLIPHPCVPRTTRDSIGKTEPEVEWEARDWGPAQPASQKLVRRPKLD